MSEKTDTVKEKTWLGRILKLIFILSAFFLVAITVLANMGGNNDAWKDSIEQFTSGFFNNRPVKVEKLVYMSFFPKIGFDAENISIYSNQEKDITLATIGKIQGFMGFWNVAFRTQKFSSFYLKDFNAVKGAVFPKELYIERIFVDHDIENRQAALLGNGKIGDDMWEVSFGLKVFDSHDILDSKNKFNYKLPEEFPFDITMADIKFHGTFLRNAGNYYKFKDAVISSGDKKLSGDLVISGLGENLLKLKGNVKVSNSVEEADIDLIFDYSEYPVKVSGSMGLSDDMIEDIIFLFMHIREVIGYQTDEKQSIKFDFSSVKRLGQEL